MDEYIGIIRMFAGTYVPEDGWLACDGTIYNISDHQALFAIISNIYGGDGKTTFAVPDLRGRFPIGAGQGAGLSGYEAGQQGGSQTATIMPENLPQHDHVINGDVQWMVSSLPANTDSPVGASAAVVGTEIYYAENNFQGDSTGDLIVNLSLGSTGSSLPFTVSPAYQAVSYLICTSGVFPFNPGS